MEEPKNEEGKNEPKNEIPNAHFEKLLKEKRNAMIALEEREAAIKELTRQLEEKESSILLEKQNYKELFENKNKAYNELDSSFSLFKGKYYNGIKYGSLRQELIKQGASESKIDVLCKLVDMSKLKYNEEHNVVLGADEEAKLLKEKVPELFGSNIPSVSHDQPGDSSITINNMEEYLKIPGEKRTPEMLKELGKKIGIDFR